MLTMAHGLLMENGWHPPLPPATTAEAELAQSIRALLPQAVRLLWNVRDDLPVQDMAEIMVERMRLLGPSAQWQHVQALERGLQAARAGLAGC